MGYYARVIISIESGKMTCMDKKIYSCKAMKKMEEDSVRNILSIAEALLEMKSINRNKYYSRQEILSMVSQVSIDLDGGSIGDNYESILCANEEDKMNIVHNICREVIKKYDVENPPNRFKWVHIK